DLPGTLTFTDLETAELVKYVDNAWHALKVAFGNEVGLIAKSLRIDSEKLIDIFLADTRLNISPAYLRPRFAFGGSCLPKDLRALTYLARSVDLDLPILNHVLASNRMLIDRGVDWVLDHPAKRVAVLGISFKSNTDDVRESPYVELVERLVGKGREVRIFDPNIKPACMMGANKDYLNRYLPHIPDLIVSEIEEAVGWADVIVVTAQHPAYADGLSKVRPDQDILDFARIGLLNGAGRYEGFLW
ncbi:MAG: UDP-glucose/GDP-mannose dehydrogenase family protein, partial [Acidobacteriaceae bacterium]|nr:UDP-glucose/GDP-mannose dehydrogenase family protein [Acidobacteriaceae bacterium]